MKIEHELSPAWREHFQDVKAKLDEHAGNVAVMKANIADREREIKALENHAAQIIRTLEKAEKLPASTSGYRLSEDCTKLLGEAKEE